MRACRVAETLRAAAEYRAAGLSVIPLRPRDKRPLLDWKTYQMRRATDDELNAWFASGLNNIGIVAGAISGGLCIIDFDSFEAYDWWLDQDLDRWLIPSVQTSKGRHAYVRLKQWPGNRRDVKRGIDFRGEGGYCVAPPSIHPSGEAYYWAMGSQTKIPTFTDLAEVGFGYLLHKPEERPVERISDGIPYSIVPFVSKGTFIGNRDRKAYWAACECRNANVPASSAIEWIAAGLSKSQPDRDPLDWATEKVRSAYGKTAVY